MITKELREYFLNDIFTTYKGTIKLKNSRFTPLLFKYRNHYATKDVIISTIVFEMINVLENYEPQSSWEEMSLDLSHPEWNIVKAKSYVNAERRIQKIAYNIKYSNGKKINLDVPSEHVQEMTELKNYSEFVHVLEFDSKRYSDFYNWFKANKNNLLNEKELKMIDDLDKSGFGVSPGYMAEYKRITGKHASEIHAYLKLIRKKVLDKWKEVSEKKAKEKPSLKEMFEQLLDLDVPDILSFIREEVNNGTEIGHLIEDKLPLEQSIELNLFIQGRGFVKMPTIYSICNILSQYVHNSED